MSFQVCSDGWELEFQEVADLVRPEEKVTYFKMSKESEGSFRDFMKNIMSESSNCIIKGSMLRERSLLL